MIHWSLTAHLDNTLTTCPACLTHTAGTYLHFFIPSSVPGRICTVLCFKTRNLAHLLILRLFRCGAVLQEPGIDSVTAGSVPSFTGAFSLSICCHHYWHTVYMIKTNARLVLLLLRMSQQVTTDLMPVTLINDLNLVLKVVNVEAQHSDRTSSLFIQSIFPLQPILMSRS